MKFQSIFQTLIFTYKSLSKSSNNLQPSDKLILRPIIPLILPLRITSAALARNNDPPMDYSLETREREREQR